MAKITTCPICKGELQMTLVMNTYYSGSSIEIRPDGSIDVQYGDRVLEEFDPIDVVQERLYCDNDHEIEAIVAAWKATQ